MKACCLAKIFIVCPLNYASVTLLLSVLIPGAEIEDKTKQLKTV
jgi:hypothetical protein